MKLLDVAGTGIKAAVAVVAPKMALRPRSPDAAEELRRRDEINARAAEARRGRAWIPRRLGWLDWRR